MSFANTYLKRYASGLAEELYRPDPDLFLTIIIPVLNEPGILACLNSIQQAMPKTVTAEIILIINQSENAADMIIEQNRLTKQLVIKWFGDLREERLKLILLEPDPFPAQKAGPGLARKIGMDIAVSRFNELKRPEGILVSLDADTLVGKNYFNQILSGFVSCKANTQTAYFEHLRIFKGEECPNPHALRMYEIYLRTVKLGLHWAGYPHSFHSLGSAFSVTASTYVKAGGMGIQQSGEDFYFLNKCVLLGRFYENNEARVYPAGRESDRVLFGTGPFIRDYDKDYQEGFGKYSWKTFEDLAVLLRNFKSLDFQLNSEALRDKLNAYSDEIALALNWPDKIAKARRQAGDEDSFKKWIWRELGGLQMVRYLNLHQKQYGAQPILSVAAELLYRIGYKGCTNYGELVLKELRKKEREAGLIRIS